MVLSGADVVRAAFREALMPPPRMTVSEWADKFRWLTSKSSAEPGPYETGRTPYMRAPMDALSAWSPVERVVVMAASQTGKTEAGNNWVGYVIDHAPGPMLYVEPRVEDLRKISKQRLDPMIDACPVLRDKVHPARSRDAGNTIFMKEFLGGILILTGANSAPGLRQTPIRWLFMDEIDEYPGDVEGEGDPVALAEARLRTYESRSKVLLVSSPTIEGRSRIKKEYDETDQSQYFVPCPDCGHMQVLVWVGFKWEHDEKTKRKVRGSVRYCCESCGVLIPEHRKTEMLERGEWRARHPELSEIARGFHIPAFYSPLGMYSWEKMVDEFDRSQGPPVAMDKFKTFVNTVWAETWTDRGEAPDWEKLYRRREAYPAGKVPKGGLILTAGVDVQKDRLECEVVAWGRRLECWSVDYIVIAGDVESAAPWQELDRVLAKPWRHELGADMQIAKMAVDASYAANTVYKWVRRHPASMVMAVHGQELLPQIVGLPRAAEVTEAGRQIRRGVKYWPIGTNMVKAQLYAILRLEIPLDAESAGLPDGWCHFPQYGQDYFKMLCAERIVPRHVRGYVRYQWEKTENDRNEALDCRVYARGAAAAIGCDRWSPRDWTTLEQSLGALRPRRDEPDSGESDDRGYFSRWHGPNSS